MHAVAFHARLDRPVTGGANTRAHLDGLVTRARKAHGAFSREYERAVAKRAESAGGGEMPDWPLSLAYLWDWSDELAWRGGVLMDGTAAPLTYEAIDAWARRTDRMVQPHEVNALMQLDGARRPATGESDGK